MNNSLHISKESKDENLLVVALLKARKSRKQNLVSSSILPPKTNKKWKKSGPKRPLVIFFRSFSGRIEDTIICFLNFLTFTYFQPVSSLCFKRLRHLSNLDDSIKNVTTEILLSFDIAQNICCFNYKENTLSFNWVI